MRGVKSCSRASAFCQGLRGYKASNMGVDKVVAAGDAVICSNDVYCRK